MVMEEQEEEGEEQKEKREEGRAIVPVRAAAVAAAFLQTDPLEKKLIFLAEVQRTRIFFSFFEQH
jgi:hypothetical protein